MICGRHSCVYVLFFVGGAIGCSGAALAACSALDSALYGRPVFPAYVFVLFNVLQGGASWFGTHPWHWYERRLVGAAVTVTP